MKEIASNKKAFFNYLISEKIEAGICLSGTEIKSIRSNGCSITDAYAIVSEDQVWLCNMNIAPYSMGNVHNHEPKRKRKLLLKKREIENLKKSSSVKGFSIIPTRVYLTNGICKVEIGLGKGKNTVDKRDSIKNEEAKRDIDRAIKLKNRSH